jgi:hypothetical protein
VKNKRKGRSYGRKKKKADGGFFGLSIDLLPLMYLSVAFAQENKLFLDRN